MNILKKGFTLIELLITIAIIGVLSAAVIVGINPLQKIKLANDSKVKSDVGQMGTAMQSYFTINQYYPATLGDLTTSSELAALPTAPTATGYSAYTIAITPAGCTTAAKTCTNVTIGGNILAPSTLTAAGYWCWHSNTSVAAESATACAAP